MAGDNWATHAMMEQPFWRKGMTIEEYEEEREYLNKHIVDFQNFTYQPLWMQRKNNGRIQNK